MLNLHIPNEINRLRAVLVGTAISNGPIPTKEEAYDPSSLQHILNGSYPLEEHMIAEMDALVTVFEKYEVKVYRPEILKDCNQIFARDIAFVIGDKIFKSNILPDRAKEFHAIEHVWDQVDKNNQIIWPDHIHMEGGDIMPWNKYIFVGTYSGEDYPDLITARTNIQAVDALQKFFPDKEVRSFQLKKSNTNPLESALHLDCCFQPLGQGKALMHKEGFLIDDERDWLINFIGEENIFFVSKEEMASMNCNVFSISPEVVISEKHFYRLNYWLEEQGFTVEKIPYKEISKQGGLLRCSTLPLIRDPI